MVSSKASERRRIAGPPALPITVTPHLGLAQINVPDTSAWPLGTLRCDLRVVTATGAILQTQTFPVVVQRRVTTP